MESVDSTLQGRYPAKVHAKRVADLLVAAGHSKDAVIYLESQKTCMIEDNDEPLPFRQRRAFYYLSGCSLPDSYLTYHISTSTLTLFIPPIEPSSVIWAGLPLTRKDALAAYDIDECLHTTELNAHLASFSHQPTTVYAIPHQVSDQTTFLGFSATNFDILHKAIDTCRVVKDAYEIALLRKANAITTLAHTAVVKLAKTARNERELEAEFIRACIANGCREQAYHSIVASGTAAATLHYVKNDQPLKGKLNILLDAAGEYNAYCADVTRTFPISGEFSTESQEIYSIVEEMQESCFSMLKAGVLWEDVHVNAHKVAISGLLKLGILKGGTADELLKSRVSVAFFPHGLGHYLGMDTHDTGGNPNYADPDAMFKHLRVRGRLPAGAVITVEPGIYFCEFIVKPAMEDPGIGKYIDWAVVKRYWEVGGVRIEDNVHITEDGYENLTTAPKEHPDIRMHGIGGHGLGDS